MKKKRVDLYAGAAFPKNPPKRDPKLRAWIAQQPCLIMTLYPMGYKGTICSMKVHAAHVPNGTGGMGMKGDDLFVPLCFFHHIDEQHSRLGIKAFEQEYGVNLRACAEEYRETYERERAA